MRSFLLLRRPLPRRTLVFFHLMVQLGLFVGGLIWLARYTPWLSSASWLEAWPTLALGSGVTLLAMVGVRLLTEVLMLPHYLTDQRQGRGHSPVTRSFERRPAVHDPAGGWVNEARPAKAAIVDEEAVGSARVIQPRRPLTPRSGATETARERQRQEPSL